MLADQGLIQTSREGQEADEAGACNIELACKCLAAGVSFVHPGFGTCELTGLGAMQESLGGQDMDEAGTSEKGPRQPLHPLPTRTSLADRLPPRPSELLKVCC